MTKFRIGLIIVAIIMILVSLILLDYNDLSWSVNAATYSVMLTAVVGIMAMVYSIRSEKE